MCTEIESSLPTLYNIVERGGRPILMTHVNRPRTASGDIVCDDENDGVGAIVDVLRAKLGVTFAAPSFQRGRRARIQAWTRRLISYWTIYARDESVEYIFRTRVGSRVRSRRRVRTRTRRSRDSSRVWRMSS